MHPAYSIIVFTTASGAGYGLLMWLAFAAVIGRFPNSPVFGAIGIGLALALVTLGLLSSTLHLGRPERAWRAMSQWRTSWLSREGVAALATYVPALLLGLAWVTGGIIPANIAQAAAVLTMLGAVVTVYCTGMIYASLPTIRAWDNPVVVPNYIMLAISTGGLLMIALLFAFGYSPSWVPAVTAAALGLAWFFKALYWMEVDQAEKTFTAESATGLGALGQVRPLDPPHTQPNYLMREMGYQVAPRHAARLRRMVTLLLFILPLLLTLAHFAPVPDVARVAFAVLAVISAGAGVLIERWLFFAEAEHVVVVYYRGGSA